MAAGNPRNFDDTGNISNTETKGTGTRRFFDRELDKLHFELIQMGSLVEESIDNAIIALTEQNVELARKVYENDDVIDEHERKIERLCMNLIARQQPLARDLRSISTALKIITDMERIADHSADISEYTLRMAGQKYIKPLDDVRKMADMAKNMVRRAIDSYIKQDLDMAKEVCRNDDDVDNLFRKIILELVNLMKKDNEAIEQAINFIMIAKYLERMADHATNIGEWVIFNITGEHKDLNIHSLENLIENRKNG